MSLVKKLFDCYLAIKSDEKKIIMYLLVYGFKTSLDAKAMERKRIYEEDVEKASPEVQEKLNAWIADHENNCAMATAMYKASIDSTLGIPYGIRHYVHPDEY
jgi:hypothetical protein